MQKEEAPVAEGSFAVGDFVFSTRLKLSGMVIDVLDGYAKVESENVRFLAPLDTLELRERQNKKTANSVADMGSAAQTELDIRGLLVEEAKHAVVKFIDNAVLSNLQAVHIIHGKGTGALREAVGELLKDDKRIDAFRLGYHNEGGSGVTIATLKAEQ